MATLCPLCPICPICPICQGAGMLTVRLHSEGRTLAEIRIAVGAQFG